MQKLTAEHIEFMRGDKNIFGDENTPEEKAAQISHLKADRMSAKPQSPIVRKALGLSANANRN